MGAQTNKAVLVYGRQRHLSLTLFLLVSVLLLMFISRPSRAAGETPAPILDYTCYNSMPTLINVATAQECYSLWQARDGGVHLAYCLNRGGSMSPLTSRYANGQITATGHVCTDPTGGGYWALFNYYCQSGVAPQQGMCPNICPSNSSPTNDPNNPCTCNAGYEWDATHTSCESTCPVPDLTPLSPDDLCAQSLEAGHGVDKYGACPQVSDALAKELQCFSNKIAATNALARPPIPYAGPTATIRNVAYQAHMQEVWDTLIELNKPENRSNESCQSLREKIVTEKGCGAQGHCIKYRPATYSNHSTGMAFDVSQRAIDGLVRELTPLPPAPMSLAQQLQFQRNAIAGWLSSPTTCNLVWGGSFQDADIFHFQLP